MFETHGQQCWQNPHSRLPTFANPHPTASPPAGVPTTPTITASGGGLASANVTWSASPTSAYYLVELLYQGVVKKSARVEHRWAAATRRRLGTRQRLCRESQHGHAAAQ